MKPYLEDTDLVVYAGDVLELLPQLPDASVDCVVTSPPYWGLRDYGTGQWVGGDSDCEHKLEAKRGERPRSGLEGGLATVEAATFYRDRCGKCGAERDDKQLGLEPTMEEYLANMLRVFGEVWRVLRPEGTLWLNMGDSYASGNRGRYDVDAAEGREHDRRPRSAKDKELLGVPWRLAFALQDAGWKLRADNIWAKPNPMPESVRDRPTKSHEYVFLFSKQGRYYYDREAVREPFSAKSRGNWSRSHHAESEKLGRAGTYRREYRHPELDAPPQAESLYEADPLSEDPGPTDGGRQRAARAGDERYLDAEYGYHEDGRDGRFQGGSGGDGEPAPAGATLPGLEEFASDDAPSYVMPDGWAIGPGAHDAVSHSLRERQPTLDPSLPPEAERGADGRRVTRRISGEGTHENHANASGRERWPNADGRNMRTVWTIPLEGFPGAHFATFPRELARRCILAGCPAGGTVLDPFGGSGTVGEVARAHGRHAILLELDPESLELIRERTQQLSLLGGET